MFPSALLQLAVQFCREKDHMMGVIHIYLEIILLMLILVISYANCKDHDVLMALPFQYSSMFPPECHTATPVE